MKILSEDEHRKVDMERQNVMRQGWGERLKQSFADIDRLSVDREGFWYLLSPYALYPFGISKAWTHITRVAASIQSTGVTVFSPIVHFHPMARVVKAIPTDNDYWMSVNRSFMDPAIGGIVAELPGWEKSDGISREIAYLTKAGKPIVQFPVPPHTLD